MKRIRELLSRSLAAKSPIEQMFLVRQEHLLTQIDANLRIFRLFSLPTIDRDMLHIFRQCQNDGMSLTDSLRSMNLAVHYTQENLLASAQSVLENQRIDDREIYVFLFNCLMWLSLPSERRLHTDFVVILSTLRQSYPSIFDDAHKIIFSEVTVVGMSEITNSWTHAIFTSILDHIKENQSFNEEDIDLLVALLNHAMSLNSMESIDSLMDLVSYLIAEKRSIINEKNLSVFFHQTLPLLSTLCPSVIALYFTAATAFQHPFFHEALTSIPQCLLSVMMLSKPVLPVEEFNPPDTKFDRCPGIIDPNSDVTSICNSDFYSLIATLQPGFLMVEEIYAIEFVDSMLRVADDALKSTYAVDFVLVSLVMSKSLSAIIPIENLLPLFLNKVIFCEKFTIFGINGLSPVQNTVRNSIFETISMCGNPKLFEALFLEQGLDPAMFVEHVTRLVHCFPSVTTKLFTTEPVLIVLVSQILMFPQYRTLFRESDASLARSVPLSLLLNLMKDPSTSITIFSSRTLTPGMFSLIFENDLEEPVTKSLSVALSRLSSVPEPVSIFLDALFKTKPQDISLRLLTNVLSVVSQTASLAQSYLFLLDSTLEFLSRGQELPQNLFVFLTVLSQTSSLQLPARRFSLLMKVLSFIPPDSAYSRLLSVMAGTSSLTSDRLFYIRSPDFSTLLLCYLLDTDLISNYISTLTSLARFSHLNCSSMTRGGLPTALLLSMKGEFVYKGVKCAKLPEELEEQALALLTVVLAVESSASANNAFLSLQTLPSLVAFHTVLATSFPSPSMSPSLPIPCAIFRGLSPSHFNSGYQFVFDARVDPCAPPNSTFNVLSVFDSVSSLFAFTFERGTFILKIDSGGARTSATLLRRIPTCWSTYSVTLIPIYGTLFVRASIDGKPSEEIEFRLVSLKGSVDIELASIQGVTIPSGSYPPYELGPFSLSSYEADSNTRISDFQGESEESYTFYPPFLTEKSVEIDTSLAKPRRGARETASLHLTLSDFLPLKFPAVAVSCALIALGEKSAIKLVNQAQPTAALFSALSANIESRSSEGKTYLIENCLLSPYFWCSAPPADLRRISRGMVVLAGEVIEETVGFSKLITFSAQTFLQKEQPGIAKSKVLAEFCRKKITTEEQRALLATSLKGSASETYSAIRTAASVNSIEAIYDYLPYLVGQIQDTDIYDLLQSMPEKERRRGAFLLGVHGASLPVLEVACGNAVSSDIEITLPEDTNPGEYAYFYPLYAACINTKVREQGILLALRYGRLDSLFMCLTVLDSIGVTGALEVATDIQKANPNMSPSTKQIYSVFQSLIFGQPPLSRPLIQMYFDSPFGPSRRGISEEASRLLEGEPYFAARRGVSPDVVNSLLVKLSVNSYIPYLSEAAFFLSPVPQLDSLLNEFDRAIHYEQMRLTYEAHPLMSGPQTRNPLQRFIHKSTFVCFRNTSIHGKFHRNPARIVIDRGELSVITEDRRYFVDLKEVRFALLQPKWMTLFSKGNQSAQLEGKDCHLLTESLSDAGITIIDNPIHILYKLAREWRRRKVSNYELILAANYCAGRCFSEPSRYPAFPIIHNGSLLVRETVQKMDPCSLHEIWLNIEGKGKVTDLLTAAANAGCCGIPDLYSNLDFFPDIPKTFVYENRKILQSSESDKKVSEWLNHFLSFDPGHRKPPSYGLRDFTPCTFSLSVRDKFKVYESGDMSDFLYFIDLKGSYDCIKYDSGVLSSGTIDPSVNCFSICDSLVTSNTVDVKVTMIKPSGRVISDNFTRKVSNCTSLGFSAYLVVDDYEIIMSPYDSLFQKTRGVHLSDHPIQLIVSNLNHKRILYTTTENLIVCLSTENDQVLWTFQESSVIQNLLMTDVWGFSVYSTDSKLCILDLNGKVYMERSICARHFVAFSTESDADVVAVVVGDRTIGAFEILYPDRIVKLVDQPEPVKALKACRSGMVIVSVGESGVLYPISYEKCVNWSGIFGYL